MNDEQTLKECRGENLRNPGEGVNAKRATLERAARSALTAGPQDYPPCRLSFLMIKSTRSMY
jgi:hypothetical protein